MFLIFILTLAGGMLVIMATVRQEQVSWRFVRLIGILTFAMVFLAMAWDIQGSGWPGAGAQQLAAACGLLFTLGAAVVVVVAPLAWRESVSFRVMCMATGLAGVTAGCALGMHRFSGAFVSPAAIGIGMASQVLAALLLGATTVSWLLGHAYLTATKMTIAPLRHFSRTLSWAVAARGAFAVLSVSVAWMIGAENGPTIFQSLANAWLVLTLRVGLGIVCLGVFAFMVSDCVRLRSTQSATGILYFASIFAYIGELASLQLMTECGWAL